MSLLNIILSIANLLFGTGFIVTALTLRQARTKAKTEVEKGNVELATEAVNNMLQSVNSLMEQNKTLVDELVKRNEEKAALIRRIADLEKKVTKMQKTNKEVIRLLSGIHVDDSILNKLKEDICEETT